MLILNTIILTKQIVTERRICLKKPVFSGACTALITPFKNGCIDYNSFDRIIEYQLQNGISALLVAGTTGESASLSYKEHSNLINHAAKRINGKAVLIAGAGSNDTKKAIKMTKYACEYGADAILSVTPYYNKATQSGLISHYEEIAKASEKPIIVYNVPGRTGVNILPETYKKLSKINGISGVKEAATNLSDFAYSVSLCPETDFYCGNDDLLVPMLSVGAKGIISVMSNIFPQITVAICRHALSGNFETANEIFMQYLLFARLLFTEINPIPIKAIMKHAGFCNGEIRLPLVNISNELEEKLTDTFKLLDC